MTSNSESVETPSSRRLWRLVALAALLAVPVSIIWWPGCRQYPAVTSRESLQLMKLLYTACNTRDPARLAKVEQGVEKATRAGKLSPAEQDAFARIIGIARAHQWQDAEKAAFRFAQDQVGQGSQETHIYDPHHHPHEDRTPKRPPKK